MSLSLGLQPQLGGRTLIQRAIASLRARGTDAHLWLPGGDVRTYGPELVTNGGFDSADLTLWPVTPVADGSAAVVGGEMQVTATSGYGGRMYALNGLSTSKQYLISATTRSVSGGSSPFIGVATSSLGSAAVQLIMTSSATTSPITQNAVFTPAASTLYLCCRDNTNTVGVVNGFDNISVREITSITSTITSGLTTGNYLESTGNSIATVDNPTGLVLDALGTVGDELVTNGGFDSDTVWSKSASCAISGGSCNFTSAASGESTSQTAVASLVKCYKYSYTVTNYVSGSVGIKVGGTLSVTASANGTVTGYAYSTGVNALVEISIRSATTTLSIDNISVREVTGIHAQQTTTANKPVLRRGLTNLLTYSSDFSNAAWSKNNCTVAVTGAAPTGNETTATATSTTFTTLVQSSLPTVSQGTSVTFAFYVRNTGTLAAPQFIVRNATTTTNIGIVTFTADTGVFVASVGSITTESLGNGWFLGALSISAGIAAGNSLWTYHGFTGNSSPAGTTLVAGAAAIFQGTYTAAQILAAGGIPVTTTAAASNPSSGKYSWSFDGSNDSLALGSVPFQMGDDHCVIAGVTPTRATDYVLNLGSGAGIQQIAAIYLSGSVVAASWVDDASTVATTSELVPVLGVSKVVSATKMSDAKRIRINSVQQGATNNTAMGVTTVTTGYIGGFKPASYPFNGSTGPVLAIKGTVTDAELLMYERLVASLTPGAPTF